MSMFRRMKRASPAASHNATSSPSSRRDRPLGRQKADGTATVLSMGDKIKGHILCVDDNRDTCEMLTVLLGEAGYDVQYALCVSEGLTKARLGGFDLILLD